MVKKRLKRKSKEVSVLDQDDVYDEIDQFHNEREQSTLNFVTHDQKSRVKEVLSVRVDDDDLYNVEDEDEEYSIGTKSKKKLKNLSETTNQWGRKARNFYGTSYVDEDFGGVNNSDEEELLNLEESDAIQRQKKQDEVLKYVNFNEFIDDSQLDDNCMNIKVERPENNFNNTIKQKKVIKQDKSQQKEIVVENKTNLTNNDFFVNQEENNNDLNNKRAITYKIMKNRGLTAKRRKDSRHARIKNRKLYSKALIRKRSQIPDIRRELAKYDGEKRGIRMSTIRSINLQ